MNRVGRILNLGSSSLGNAFYIELFTNNEQKNILIECGFEYKELLRRMVKNGIDINSISDVFVTHAHKDHSASVKQLVNAGIPIFAPQSVFTQYDLPMYEFTTFEEYERKMIYDGFSVVSIPLEHYDTDKKVENFGYIFEIENDFKMLFAIDTKYIPQDLSKFQFNVIFIEANYLHDKIHFAMKNATKSNNYGEQKRYSRLLDSHLSLENLAKTLDGTISKKAKAFDLSKTKAIFLTHLSSNNQTNDNYYKQFLLNYLERTKEKTSMNDDLQVVVCKKEGGFLWV